jgi:RNA polymerase sigma factor (sigma-70 family)
MTDSSRDQTVFVIDDDPEFADSVRFLLTSVNLPVHLFQSAESFLEQIDAQAGGCVLADVRMPGMSGLQLQNLLADKAPDLPVIIMTAHGDIDMAVRAMKDGAMDFIQKPFNDQRLIDLINKAMRLNQEAMQNRHQQTTLEKRLEGLTQRENEVLDLIVEGNTNKEIAYRLGISDKTVEVHRARIMEKTQAGSLQDLMKLVLAINPDKST